MIYGAFCVVATQPAGDGARSAIAKLCRGGRRGIENTIVQKMLEQAFEPLPVALAATALMPPLAVVGFGIGTRAWAIAGGALLLFFTNLIAIALAVSKVG